MFAKSGGRPRIEFGLDIRFSFKIKVLFIFRERGRKKGGRKKGRETVISCLLYAPDRD